MNDEQNITYRSRYRNLRRSSSLVNISNEDSSLFNDTIRSLPNSSLDESQTIIDLHDKIKILQSDLDVAHAEVDNLNSRNNSLQTELDKCRRTIDAFKLLSSDRGSKTPLTGRKKRNNSRHNSSSSNTPDRRTTPEKTNRI